MTPPSASGSAASARRPAHASPSHARKTPLSAGRRLVALRLVPPRRGAKRKRSVAEQTRRLHVVAVIMVALALVAVVVGQALLASGQVRMAALQHDLRLEQSANRQHQQAVTALETPARIVGAATNQLHMVRTSSVTELPYVPLSAPLPTPKVIGARPAPAAPAPATP